MPNESLKFLSPEEQLNLLVSQASGYAIILLDTEGRVTLWSAGAETIFGYASGETVGLSGHLIFTQEDKELGVPELEFAKAAAQGQAPDFRWHLKKDGSRFWAEGLMIGLRDGSGFLTGFGKILRDASDRKRADEALRLSEERYRAAFDNAVVGVALTDLDGSFIQVNRAYCSIVGFSSSELLSRNFQSLTHPEDRAGNAEQITEILSGVTSSFVIEKRYIRKDGQIVWVQNSVSPVADLAGIPHQILALTEDITDRKLAEVARDQALAALHESEGQFRLMADIMPHIAWTAEPNGSVIYYNKRWYDYSALTFDETRDWGWAKVIHPDDLSFAAAAWQDALDQGVVCEVEYRLRRGDGEYRWHLGRSVPYRDEAGQVSKWIGTATDIQHRIENEQAQTVLLQREQTIASQLQSALQPDSPRSVPGLKLSRYYAAALPEAGVGGDFYDIYPLENGGTALVVGDLSGKGLAAAAQVATLRNMLRAFLYTRVSVAEAVSELNNVLEKNGLLTGFATIFVGVYKNQTLTYCNCGQEPALIRRFPDRRVEQLLPTGPIVGVMPGAHYSEASVRLYSGDAIAIFSDGLTECGPVRTAMLEIDGVIRLFGEAVPEESEKSTEQIADALNLMLIHGVDRFAEGGVRDDVVLVVGVVP